MACVALLGLVTGLGYIAVDYFSLKNQIAELEELKQKSDQQTSRIEQFNEHYRELQLHFNHLNDLSNKLRSMVITSIDSQDSARLNREQDEQKIQEKIEIVKNTSILDAIATEPSEIDSDQKYERELRFANLISFFKTKKNPFVNIPSGLPVNGYLIDEFGLHTDPYTGQVRPQNGISIASRLDFPISAPANGIVKEIRTDEDLGNTLLIDHGNGFKTLYGHIGHYQVDVGDIVNSGNTIALVGNTGRTTGPRLYYEILFNHVPQNPVKYMNN